MDSIPYSRQEITEADIAAVSAVLRSELVTQGPVVQRFEQAFAQRHAVAHAVAVSNATSALHLACLALGVGPGSRVWTSPISFVASSNCALYCGATVDFVDIDPATRNLSVDRLRDKLEDAEPRERRAITTDEIAERRRRPGVTDTKVRLHHVWMMPDHRRETVRGEPTQQRVLFVARQPFVLVAPMQDRHLVRAMRELTRGLRQPRIGELGQSQERQRLARTVAAVASGDQPDPRGAEREHDGARTSRHRRAVCAQPTCGGREALSTSIERMVVRQVGDGVSTETEQRARGAFVEAAAPPCVLLATRVRG